MTYTPTNWQAGDVITAEKLNKIEQATGAKFYYIEIEHVQGDDQLANATLFDLNYEEVSAEQVFQECKAGCTVFVTYKSTSAPLVYFTEEMDDYTEEMIGCQGVTFGSIYQAYMDFSQFSITYVKNVEGSANSEWRLNLVEKQIPFAAN